MNNNKKAGKVTAQALTAGMLIAASAMTVNASPLAGATGSTASTLTAINSTSNHSSLNSATQETSTYTTTSGVSQYLSKMLQESKQEASTKTTTSTENTDASTTDSNVETNQETAVAASPYASIGVANVTDYAYIRTAADANSDYAGKLHAGQVATVTGEEGDWYAITSGDVTGYIAKQYLTVGDEALIQSVTVTTATVNADSLRVRTAPSTDASVLTMVAGTTEYTVFDTATEGWVGIQTPAGNGYVSAEFVSVATSYHYAESKDAETARLAAEKAAAEAEAKKKEEAAAKKAQSKKTSTTNCSKSSSKSYSSPSGSNGSAVVSYASQYVGNSYSYGGSSLTNGTDCSGFVMSVYSAFGVSLPHSSSGMRSVGTGVSTSEMQAGDIVCYNGHVGIYTGNGTIVNALNKKSGITYTDVNYAKIVAVRRVL